MSIEIQNNYIFNYSDVKNQDKISKFIFTSLDEMQDFLDEIAENQREFNPIVYLFTFNLVGDVKSEYQEVLVSHNFQTINDFIMSYACSYAYFDIDDMIDCEDDKFEDMYIFEFNSYEEAYKVALDMKEIYPNCYESNHTNNN